MLSVFALAVQAADKLYVQQPALYDKNLSIDAKVKEECAIDSKVSAEVQKSAGGQFEVVAAKSLTEAGLHKALALTIIGVEGAGGGAWSGMKVVTVRGTLTQGGRELGSFTAKRSSGGGAFGGYKSTCSIFGRDAKGLGQDIAKWLAAPTANAKLGELK
jgi:hypothetical protein